MIKIKNNIEFSDLKQYGFHRVDDKIFSSDMFRGFMKNYIDNQQAITVYVHDKNSTGQERSIDISGNLKRDIHTIIFDSVAEDIIKLFQNDIIEVVENV